MVETCWREGGREGGSLNLDLVLVDVDVAKFRLPVSSKVVACFYV